MKIELVKKGEYYFVRFKRWYSLSWRTVGMNHNWRSKTVYDDLFTRKTKDQAESIFKQMKAEIEIIKKHP